jgi:hypothetical protein
MMFFQEHSMQISEAYTEVKHGDYVAILELDGLGQIIKIDKQKRMLVVKIIEPRIAQNMTEKFYFQGKSLLFCKNNPFTLKKQVWKSPTTPSLVRHLTIILNKNHLDS